MADYIPDLDLSSLFNDDFDLDLASQNDLVTVPNCHEALYTSAFGRFGVLPTASRFD
jgi:hypothetical protein